MTRDDMSIDAEVEDYMRMYNDADDGVAQTYGIDNPSEDEDDDDDEDDDNGDDEEEEISDEEEEEEEDNVSEENKKDLEE